MRGSSPVLAFREKSCRGGLNIGTINAVSGLPLVIVLTHRISALYRLSILVSKLASERLQQCKQASSKRRKLEHTVRSLHLASSSLLRLASSSS